MIASSLLLHAPITRTAPQGAVSPAREKRRTMTDEALVGRIAEGDHDAFAALYDRHSAVVYGVARRVLGDGPQAEDIAQSVFLQVWTRPELFRGGSFAAWVARVARNAAIDVLRSAAVRLREPELSDDVEATVCTEDEVFARVSAEAIATALAALPDEQRGPIERAYFRGLSYREVAEEIGAPVGTVKSRIRTGLRRLSDSLREAVTP